MFRITDKKGFQITFENGYTVSVQFGPGNYCDNYNLFIGRDEEESGKIGSESAETALIDNNGNLVKYDGSDVQSWRTPDQVLALLNFASSLKGE